MGLRTSAEYIRQQEKNKEILINEGIMGITLRAALPNLAFPLKEESEAMYFKRARDFLETTVANVIFSINQDVYGGK